MGQLLTEDQVRTALVQLDGWEGDSTAIRRTAVLPSFLAAIDVVRRVADVAEGLDHHPDIDIRWRTLLFACSTHSDNGVTSKDTELAGRIDAIIGEVQGGAGS
jgi:4a-hydroxytetrahydrobiopterin dehydratase